jgi:hypothetical protein
VYPSPEGLFCTPGNHFENVEEHTITLTGIFIQKIDCGSLYLPNMRCIFEKNPNLRKFNILPGDEYNGELITNTNNYTNIRQNLKKNLSGRVY